MQSKALSLISNVSKKSALELVRTCLSVLVMKKASSRAWHIVCVCIRGRVYNSTADSSVLVCPAQNGNTFNQCITSSVPSTPHHRPSLVLQSTACISTRYNQVGGQDHKLSDSMPSQFLGKQVYVNERIHIQGNATPRAA